MKTFNNMKTGSKIIIGFILVAIITGIVGGVGIVITRTVDGYLESLYSDRMLPNGILGKIQVNQARTRLEMSELLYMSQLGDVEEIVEDVKESLTAIAEENNLLIAEFEKHSLTSEEQSLLESFKKSNTQYRAIREEIMELVSEKNIVRPYG